MRLSTKNLAQVAFSLFSVSSLAEARSASRRASTCNGHSELCNKSFGNVTFVGTHDSYAVGTDNLATNQDYNITQQLNDGVRMLQSQVHNQSGTIQLCHTNCALFNGGTLEDYLTELKSWMDANPNDVVSLLIVNSDGFAASDFDTVFKSAGVDSLSYSPSSQSLSASDWPTLGNLIDDGKRLVTFLASGADSTTAPYLIDEFTNMWETAYDVTDTSFNCSVDRSNGDTTNQMYLINHFLDTLTFGQPTPDRSDADTTNAVSGTGSLGQQVSTCESQYGKAPNFMLVDFYEYGNGSVFEVAATANGVTYSPTSAIATPKSSSSSSSSSGAADVRINRGGWAGFFTVVVGITLGAWSVV